MENGVRLESKADKNKALKRKCDEKEDAKKAAPKATAIQEISFWLRVKQQPPKLFTLSLNGPRRTVTIGRRPDSDVQISSSVVSNSHCELRLRVKNREVVLSVENLSRNLTGTRSAKDAAAKKQFKELNTEEIEDLHHNSQLLVPARLPSDRDASQQQEISVIFVLPDMFCDWTGQGRWLYHERLGEGGLAVVYRATDITGSVGDAAVKVSKFYQLPQASAQNRHVYALHREAQWSLQRLHNAADGRFDAKGADLFVRYLEDHTGFATSYPMEFDEVRARFEEPSFPWAENEFPHGTIAERPYVVMELISGRLLQRLFDARTPAENPEKRAIVIRCAEALAYMGRFGVIHRDFRGCNIFCVGSGADCHIKVIDLGFMISTGSLQVKNPNPAVRCAWQGDPSKKLRFDWAPPEVRQPGSPNFAVPAQSFDIFSFGVIVLKLLRGRTWVHEALHDPAKNLTRAVVEQLSTPSTVGLPTDLLLRMVDHSSAGSRPTPTEILRTVAGAQLSAVPLSGGGSLTPRLHLGVGGSTTAEEAFAAAEAESYFSEDRPCFGLDDFPVTSVPVPEILRITVPRGHVECDGLYRLVPAETPNGFPLWQKEGGGTRWLYSSVSGKWHIGTTHEKKKNFDCSSGWVFHNDEHNGQLPHRLLGSWRVHDTESNDWLEDGSVRVAALQANDLALKPEPTTATTATNSASTTTLPLPVSVTVTNSTQQIQPSPPQPQVLHKLPPPPPPPPPAVATTGVREGRSRSRSRHRQANGSESWHNNRNLGTDSSKAQWNNPSSASTTSTGTGWGYSTSGKTQSSTQATTSKASGCWHQWDDARNQGRHWGQSQW